MTKAVVRFLFCDGVDWGGVTERMAKKALLLRHPVRGADTPAPQRETWSATGGVICVSGTGLICFFVECYIPCI